MLIGSLEGRTGMSLDHVARALDRGDKIHGHDVSNEDLVAAAKEALAAAGTPAPSKPANETKGENPTNAKETTNGTKDTVETKTAEKPTKDAKTAEKKGSEGTAPSSSAELPKGPSGDLPTVVNSSTHRNEHARLQRKMASLDETSFPHMHRLWGGTRQDTYVFV